MVIREMLGVHEPIPKPEFANRKGVSAGYVGASSVTSVGGVTHTPVKDQSI
jgi:hypothetical protein